MEKSFFGREMYYAEYIVKLRWLKDCNQEIQMSLGGPTLINCMAKQKKRGFFPALPVNRKKAGTVEELSGKVAFRKTDKGWRSRLGEVIEVSR